ncbi:MAG: DoxX family protein [Planctomycetales bacterium]|nr:DoxX family protein [Planctomycetales bacterium]
MSRKTQILTGWILTGLVGTFLLVGSAIPKFIDFPNKSETMSKLEIPLAILPTVGVIEIAVTVLFLIPRTSFLGAILATGYLGGAVWTHLRIGDAWFFPVIVGILIWVALGLRRPAIFRLAFSSGDACPPSEKS